MANAPSVGADGAQPLGCRARDSAKRRCFCRVGKEVSAYEAAGLLLAAFASFLYSAMSFLWSLTIAFTNALSNWAPDSAARCRYSACSFGLGCAGGVTPMVEAALIAC